MRILKPCFEVIRHGMTDVCAKDTRHFHVNKMRSIYCMPIHQAMTV